MKSLKKLEMLINALRNCSAHGNSLPWQDVSYLVGAVKEEVEFYEQQITSLQAEGTRLVEQNRILVSGILDVKKLLEEQVKHY